MTEPEDVDYGMVLPFVVVASKGGPFDDDAYVAGFEAGQMFESLSHIRMHSPDIYMKLAMPVHAANRDQLDLIAMHYGLTAKFTEVADDWLALTLSAGTNRPDSEPFNSGVDGE
jgi:hypothetical protein